MDLKALAAGQAPWITVSCVILAILLCVSWIGFGLPARIRRRFKLPLPESSVTYSSRSLDEFLSRIGAVGVGWYRLELGWDIPFALVLGVLLFGAVHGLWLPLFHTESRWRTFASVVVWFPVIYAVADVLEDLFLLYAVPRPAKNEVGCFQPVPGRPVRIARWTTIAKFVSAIASGLLILGGGVGSALAIPRDRHPQRQVLFDYSMPARFGIDGNGDGLTDYMHAGEIQQKTFTLNLDACATRGSISKYVWSIENTPDGEVTESTLDCQLSLDLPEGKYPVTLQVHWRDGLVLPRSKQVTVRDWLIVAAGDSFASGQGAPQARSGPIPHWQESSCARSSQAGAAQAALVLEQEDPRSSVTFVHVACSGATIEKGILAPEDAGAAGDIGESQVAAIKRLVGARRIDALVLSIGGNDIGFRGIIQRCLIPLLHCGSRRQTDRVQARIGDLTGLLGGVKTLDACLTAMASCPANERLSSAPSHIFVTAYPDMTQRWKKGELHTCRYLSISPKEFAWARDSVLRPLNSGLDEAWRGLGATFLSFPPDVWESHGICAHDPWFRGVLGSLEVEAGINGAFHPNDSGYASGYEPVILAGLHEAGIGPANR